MRPAGQGSDPNRGVSPRRGATQTGLSDTGHDAGRDRQAERTNQTNRRRISASTRSGFASAEPFFALKDILLRHRALGRESGFEEPDLDHTGDPRTAMWTAPFHHRHRRRLSVETEGCAEIGTGRLSRHDRPVGLGGRLPQGGPGTAGTAGSLIRERVPGVRTGIMVDTGALSDRAVAERAGIGYVGKNCALITPDHGSWVFLGEMLTNIPFEPDEPVTESCGDCTLCLDACPTGALVGPGQIHAKSCISYLTQTKGFLDDKWKLKIGNRLYGCDTCQVVCPKNKGMNWTHHDELQPDPDIVKPLLKPLLSISNREFKAKFGTSAAAWRGKKPIQRNAVIALGHFRDASAVPDLAGCWRKTRGRKSAARQPGPSAASAAPKPKAAAESEGTGDGRTGAGRSDGTRWTALGRGLTVEIRFAAFRQQMV